MGRGSFPETPWSTILQNPDPQSPLRQERLNHFFSLYWRPVYKLIRARGTRIEDAKDLAQAFFCHVLESELLVNYEHDRGRFRNYLKGALRNFLAEDYRFQQAQKRGGGRCAISLETDEVETQSFQEDLRTLSPDENFDRQWALDVMAHAISRLRGGLIVEGKQKYFAAYEAYVLAEGPPRPTYAGVAKSLGLSVDDVHNYLAHAKDRLQGLILDQIRDYVTSSEEALMELRDLFGG